MSYDGASVGIIDKLDNRNVARIVTITADNFDPHFVFSTHKPKAAARKSNVHNAQCWSAEIRGCSSNIISWNYFF